MIPARNLQKVFNINENRKIKIKKLIKDNSEIIMYIDDFNLGDFQEVNVVLQNVKTREEYKCNFSKNDNTLLIDLKSLGRYFTDYEGGLYIILTKENNCTCITPLSINKVICDDKNNLEKTEFQWYIRLLENGEVRLSSIKSMK